LLPRSAPRSGARPSRPRRDFPVSSHLWAPSSSSAGRSDTSPATAIAFEVGAEAPGIAAAARKPSSSVPTLNARPAPAEATAASIAPSADWTAPPAARPP